MSDNLTKMNEPETKDLVMELSLIDHFRLPIKLVDKLVVNTSNDCRIISQKSEEEGIRDIRELVETSDLEEAFMYLPEKNVWIGVGVDKESVTTNGDISKMSVFVDGVYTAMLMMLYNELVSYHFHPASFLLSMMNHERKKLEQEGIFRSEISFLAAQKKIYAKSAIPSPNDLGTFVNFSTFFYKFRSKGKIKGGLCSKYGRTEFYLTEEGREYYKNNPQAIRTSTEAICPSFEPLLFDMELDEFATINRICKKMSNENIALIFTPYEK